MNLKLVPIILKLKYPSPHKQKNKTKRVHVKSRVRSSFISWQKLIWIIITLAGVWRIGLSLHNFSGKVS